MTRPTSALAALSMAILAGALPAAGQGVTGRWSSGATEARPLYAWVLAPSRVGVGELGVGCTDGTVTAHFDDGGGPAGAPGAGVLSFTVDGFTYTTIATIDPGAPGGDWTAPVSEDLVGALQTGRSVTVSAVGTSEVTFNLAGSARAIAEVVILCGRPQVALGPPETSPRPPPRAEPRPDETAETEGELDLTPLVEQIAARLAEAAAERATAGEPGAEEIAAAPAAPAPAETAPTVAETASSLSEPRDTATDGNSGTIAADLPPSVRAAADPLPSPSEAPDRAPANEVTATPAPTPPAPTETAESEQQKTAPTNATVEAAEAMAETNAPAETAETPAPADPPTATAQSAPPADKPAEPVGERIAAAAPVDAEPPRVTQAQNTAATTRDAPAADGAMALITNRIETACTGDAEIARGGIVETDLDGDGKPDYLVNWGEVTCLDAVSEAFRNGAGRCRAPTCTFEVYASSAQQDGDWPQAILASSVELVPHEDHFALRTTRADPDCAEAGTCDLEWRWAGDGLTPGE